MTINRHARLPGNESGRGVRHTAYGMHLTLRLAHVRRPEALDDPTAISRFLSALVARLGMRILAGPIVAREEEGSFETLGCSGVVILHESHAAIHTYPHRGAAFVDVFSCRDFAVAQVADTLAAHFGDHDVVEQTLADRGVHWSADASTEMLEWRRERAPR